MFGIPALRRGVKKACLQIDECATIQEVILKGGVTDSFLKIN